MALWLALCLDSGNSAFWDAHLKGVTGLQSLKSAGALRSSFGPFAGRGVGFPLIQGEETMACNACQY